MAREFTQDEINQIKTNMKRLKRNRRQRENRHAKDEAYKSCGLVRVRVMGKTFWE